jgi:hypothetical protein
MDTDLERLCIERLKSLGIHEKIVRHDLLGRLAEHTLSPDEVSRIELHPELYRVNGQSDGYRVVHEYELEETLKLSESLDEGYDYVRASRRMTNGHLDYIAVYRMLWMKSRGQGFHFLWGIAKLV